MSIASPSVKPAVTERLRQIALKWRWPLLLAGALLLGFSVIFPQIGLVEWVALVPALAVILLRISDPNVKLRHLWGMGFVFFFTFLLVTFHWFLYMYPLDFAGMSRAASAVVVCFAWIGLSAFQAIGAAFLLPLAAIAVRGKFLSRHPILHPLLFAAMWTTLEWWWAHSGWSGVPWSRLALGQAELLPTMQIASVFGSYAVTLLILLVNGYLAYLLLHPEHRALCLFLSGSLFFGNLGGGAIRLALYEDRSDQTVMAAAIQGNKSSLDYWSFTTVDEVMERYGALTREAVSNGAEIVVWPETGVPVNIDRSEKVRTFVTDLSEECGVPILVGVFTEVFEGSAEEYNSIVAALPDGTIHETVYHKRNPVPFGEFVPFRNLIMTLVPPLAEINTLDEDIPAGEESVVFDLALGNVGALICFDSIYEGNALDSVANGAELLTVSTNDSWFRDSRGVWMHHAQAQYRAIETGRYVVRSASTGVSSVISATGEIVDSINALETGYALGEVTLRDTTTPYSRIGNLLAGLCLAVSAIAIIGAPAERVVNFVLKKKRNGKES